VTWIGGWVRSGGMAFADFQGRHDAIEILQRSIGRARLGHAYLFSGDDGVELAGVARTLAKVVNCEQRGAGTDSCDTCSSCRRIESGNHPDVLWVRPESRSRVILIDQVREIQHAVGLKPTEARTKVAVVVDAERMNTQAANAFLKTLEEPSGNSMLILLSSRPQNLIETILSRCLHLRFAGGERRLAAGVADWLSRFAGYAAKPGQGMLGRYELLVAMLSRLEELRSGVEQSMESESPLRQYEDAEAKVRERWEDELKAAVEAEYRRLRTEFLTGLQWFFRDVWFKTLGLGDSLLALPELGMAAAEVGRRLDPDKAYENLRLLGRAQGLLETNLQEALILEVTLLRLQL
jgi:DNA polymerase III delta' subunit